MGLASTPQQVWAPRGLLFAVADGESAIVSRMLASVRRFRVVVEPSLLSQLVLDCFNDKERGGECDEEALAVRVRQLSWLLCGSLHLGQTAAGALRLAASPPPSSRCFLCLQSSLAEHASLLVDKAFPQVHWAAIVREPASSLATQLRTRTPPQQGWVAPCLCMRQAPPAALRELLRTSAATAAPSAQAAAAEEDGAHLRLLSSDEAFCAASIAIAQDAILDLLDTEQQTHSPPLPRGAVVDWTTLPGAVPALLEAHFQSELLGGSAADGERARMLKVAAQSLEQDRLCSPAVQAAGAVAAADAPLGNGGCARRDVEEASWEVREAAARLLNKRYELLRAHARRNALRLAPAPAAQSEQRALEAVQQVAAPAAQSEQRALETVQQVVVPAAQSEQRALEAVQQVAAAGVASSVSESAVHGEEATSTAGTAAATPAAAQPQLQRECDMAVASHSAQQLSSLPPLEPLPPGADSAAVARFFGSVSFASSYWERRSALLTTDGFFLHGASVKTATSMEEGTREDGRVQTLNAASILALRGGLTFARATPKARASAAAATAQQPVREFNLMMGAFYLPAPENSAPAGIGAASGEHVAAALARGWTAVFNGANAWPEAGGVRALALLLSEALGRRTHVNAYLAPSGLQVGTAAHNDQHDFVVAQLEGSKRWRVWVHPPMMLPLQKQAHSYGAKSELDLALLGAPDLDVLLRPGQLLYVPRGAVHLTSTDAGSAAAPAAAAPLDVQPQVADDTTAPANGGGSNGAPSDCASPSLHLTVAIATDAFHLPWALGAAGAPGVPQHNFLLPEWIAAVSRLSERSLDMRRSVALAGEAQDEWVERMRLAMHAAVDEIVDHGDLVANVQQLFAQVRAAGARALLEAALPADPEFFAGSRRGDARHGD